MFHNAVLLNESLNGLAIAPGGTYVDVTYGGGGHSAGILERLENGRLFAFDQDEAALPNALPDERLTLIHANFRHFRNFLKLYKAVPVDGILADLGISSHQIDEPERGFSTRYDGELDMRMDRRARTSALTVIRDYSETELARVFREYGEIRNAGRVAGAIYRARKEKEIRTTLDLREILLPFSERGKENKFLAQVFQALRIEVNQELEALKILLVQGTEMLKPGGRLVIISYHSLEDLLVKRYFSSGNFEGIPQKDFYGNALLPLKSITRKPITPGESEISMNNRARSARLRIAEKI
jgi:16S rRNA (cytosine1402-N4)-methyltransferase